MAYTHTFATLGAFHLEMTLLLNLLENLEDLIN